MPFMLSNAASRVKPSSRPLLSGVQAARGIAALLVVLFHLSSFAHEHFQRTFLWDIGRCGYSGVDFFFVLSGFLITTIHWDDLGKPAAFGVYVYKRFVRVFPFYWVVLTGMFVLRGLGPSALWVSPADTLKSFLLWPVPDHYLLSVAWTLSYEIFFYAVFALGILSRRLLGFVFAAWCVGFLMSANNHSGSVVFSFLVLDFQLGVATALVMRRWKLPRPFVVGGGAGFVAICLAALDVWVIPDEVRPALRLGYALCASIGLWSVVQIDREQGLRVPGWLAALGDASYSIYLTHMIFISGLAKLQPVLKLEHWPFVPTILAAGVSVVAAGWLIHRTIEVPLLRILRRRSAH